MEFALLSDRIHDVAARDRSIIFGWLLTRESTVYIKSEEAMDRVIPSKMGLANNKVARIAVDREGIAWFGTESGISNFKIATGEWTTYNRDNGLPSNRITAISVLMGIMFGFGTDKGLARYNKPINIWALRTTDDGGLPSNQIIDIAVENEYVWVATDKGVSRYDKKIDSWTQFTKSDGLADDRVTTIAIDEDYVLVWHHQFRCQFIQQNRSSLCQNIDTGRFTQNEQNQPHSG